MRLVYRDGVHQIIGLLTPRAKWVFRGVIISCKTCVRTCVRASVYAHAHIYIIYRPNLMCLNKLEFIETLLDILMYSFADKKIRFGHL